MSTCCEDPTEPQKLDPRLLRQEQQKYGDLLRDLFTCDPEKVILKLKFCHSNNPTSH